MSIRGQQHVIGSQSDESLDNRSVKTVSKLDVEVSARQAFGVSYAKPANFEARLTAYWSGKIMLPPQPVWEGDPTNWTADPFNDRNWRFQHHTLRWINPLRWAALEGDEAARTEWVRIARSWAEANVPASKTGSDFAWKDMADGNRATQLSLGAPLVDPEDDWFVELLEYHRDWLMDEKHIVGKNHGLHQHSGLIVVGAVLRDRQAIETAVSRMRAQFASTFDIQGTNDEGSSTYHQMNMNWWSQAWERARLEGINPPSDVQARIDSAAHVLAHIALPDGQLPQIGDASRGRVTMGRSDVTDFVASEGKIGSPPSETALVLDRGYIVSRSGWGQARPLADESHMIIRHGDELRAHSHRDRGSIHIYASGRRWLVDSGFHSYQFSAPENKYLKSREAHNIASLVGHKHDHDAPVELIASDIFDTYHDFTLIDHGYKDAELSRRILYFAEADCWLVVDTAKSDSPVELTHRWHVEPETTSWVRDNGYLLSAESKSFGMYWLGRGNKLSLTRAKEGSLDAWIGTRWRTLVPSSRIIATSSKDRPQLVVLFGSHSPLPLSIIGSRVTTTGDILAHVARGASHWRISIRGDQVSVKKG